MPPAKMKCEPGWPRTLDPLLSLPPGRPGDRQRDLGHRAAPRGRPGSPRRLAARWPGHRATPRSRALPAPSDRPRRPHPLPVLGSPLARSLLHRPVLLVLLSWRATSGHRPGWTRGGCPGVQGSCFRSWSCSLSAQVGDLGRRERGHWGSGRRWGHRPGGAG